MHGFSAEFVDFILINMLHLVVVGFLFALFFKLNKKKTAKKHNDNDTETYFLGSFYLQFFPVVVLSVAMSVVFIFLLLWIASLPFVKETGFFVMSLFIAIEIITLFYVIKKGGLEWK